LAIAENFRFVPRFLYAAEQVAALGRVTHFSVKVMGLMKDENKYYKTSWRTKPAYQGGFLLDGGVHHAAATRLLLGEAPVSVRAFTSLTHPHLAPIDTVAAIVKTESGATGTYFHSAGSLMDSFEWEVACEGGSVRSDGDVVTVSAGGSTVDRTFEKTSGVAEEVDAWAASILGAGSVLPRQSPGEALADLEFLERMFTSGAEGGELKAYELQK
jgi:predicted dehydrogenase